MNIKYQTTIQIGALGGLIGSVIGTLIPSIGPIIGLVVGVSLAVISEHLEFVKRARNQPLQTVSSACNQVVTTSYGRMLLKTCVNTLSNEPEASMEEPEAFAEGPEALAEELVTPSLPEVDDLNDYIHVSNQGEETPAFVM